VVFGSVQSVARNLDAFDGAFSLLIIDECHRVSLDDDSQYHQVIEHLKAANPALKIRAHRHPLSAGAGLDLPAPLPRHGQEPRRAAVWRLRVRTAPALHGEKRLPDPAAPGGRPHRPLRLQQAGAAENGLFSEAQLNGEIKRQERVTPHILSQVLEYAADRQG
jgi:DNA repair protein RadD